MNEELAAPVVEQPIVAPIQTEEVVEAPEPALSIADHRAQYDPKRDKSNDPVPDEPLAPLAADATPEQKAAHHSERQRREKTGEFRQGKKRHRAASQQATAADAPRIIELNRKLKEANDQIQRLSAPTARPIAQPTQQAAPVAPALAERVPQGQSAQRWIGDAKNDPEPQEADFGGDPMKYLSARFQWEARGVNRYERHEAAQQHEQLQRSISWGERVERAIAKPGREDYAQVAFQPVPWASGSAIDKFIDADDNGAEILYHLNSNPQDRDALLRMGEFQQNRFLALLSQRFDPASSSAAAAGGTGSAPRSNVRHLVPRPPNPVRTEPQGATAGPPTDGSLSIAAHKKHFAPQRR